MNVELNSTEETRDWLQDLLKPEGPFFDTDGVLRGAIDVRTLHPFTKEFCDTQTQLEPPEPLGVDYLAGITYEDSWDAMGNYLEYLVARYGVAQESFLLDEMRRIVQLAIEVYREDNPEDMVDWHAKKGSWRRLYAGRYGKWPYPEILGTDQMAPLMFGLLEARPFLESGMQEGLDEVLIGALGWYMRRNFTYIYRATANHTIEMGPHALSYYVPALVWAHKITGEPKYLKAFQRLHEDYLYNPDYFLSNWEMPYIPTVQSPEDRFIWLHQAFRWSMWVAWLSENAPNANYYQWLFDEFAEWNTRLLNNTLPTGLGHDYDNMAPTTVRYPEQWVGNPTEGEGTVAYDGYDAYGIINRARMPALRKCRELTYFALLKPDEIDVTPVVRILPLCNTPDHFTYFYDPEDIVLPPHMWHRSHSLQAQFVTSWLAAYWRLAKLGHVQG